MPERLSVRAIVTNHQLHHAAFSPATVLVKLIEVEIDQYLAGGGNIERIDIEVRSAKDQNTGEFNVIPDGLVVELRGWHKG